MKIAAIAFNTFLELIRNPFYGLILVVTALLIGLSPAFAMFTLMESVKMVQDMALANMLLAGLFLSIFSAGDSLIREMQSHTVLTLLSKPMNRATFLLGKFCGVILAQFVALFLLTLVSLMIIKFGVKDAAYQDLGYPVLWLMVGAVVFSLLGAAALNFLANKVYLSSAIMLAVPAFSVAFLVACIVDKEYHLATFGADINWDVGKAAILVFMVCAILSAASIMLATRLNVALTSIGTTFLFMLGLMWSHLVGRHVEVEAWARWLYGFYVDVQVFWVTDALNADLPVPMDYLVYAMGYASTFIIAFLCMGCALFHNAEVS